jgi:transglutaminase-like putative cysteine protease
MHYIYDRPAASGRHLMRLVPADIPGIQRVERASSGSRPNRSSSQQFTDFFGNAA